MNTVKFTPPAGTPTYKNTFLRDGNGHKLNRKIRRDEKGLYIIRYGSKGRLKKSIQQIDCGEMFFIAVTRQVDYYEG